jgi:hypothetical protein
VLVGVFVGVGEALSICVDAGVMVPVAETTTGLGIITGRSLEWAALGQMRKPSNNNSMVAVRLYLFTKYPPYA